MIFTASLPKLLTFAALVGALVALAFPSAPLDRATPHAVAPVPRNGHEIRPAIYAAGDRSPDEQEAWVLLVVTFELLRSSEEVLEEAQSLRAIAAAFAAGSADPGAQPDAQAAAPDRARRELAEGQLALADKVLRTAQAHAANTQAAFGMAWQRVQRATEDNAWQDPGQPLRQLALNRRRPG